MTPTDPRLQTPDARRAANRLLDVLQRERPPDDATVGDPSVAGACIGARAALIERAKGALMVYYGVDSHQAFDVLIGWARTSRSSVPTVAYALLHGICQDDPQIEARHRPLVRWLEANLRDGGPGQARLRSEPTGCCQGPEALRSG